MAYLSLLLIAILTVASGATPLYCSDVQSPAASGSENTDLSQVTTLQYCIIDNFTIMRIDTGQQLDIIYTTESLLIVTPKDGHTSMVITKIDDELPCLEYLNTTDNSHTIHHYVQVITTLLQIPVCTYTLTVHLLFKNLRRSLFGKLLMFYNLFVVSKNITAIVLLIMHYWITVNSQTVCHIATIAFILTLAGEEVFTTNILYHSAYIMYRCYHVKTAMSKKRSEYLFRHYIAYAGFTLILLFFVAIAHDWRTGMDKYTILPNGHCSFADPSSYSTFYLFVFIAFINKVLQMMMFSAYLYYLYKFNLNVRAAQVTLDVRYSRKLFRIATAMGASIGFSFFVYFLVVFIPEYTDIIISGSGTVDLIQQVVIMTSFMCTKKMYAKCKACCLETDQS